MKIYLLIHILTLANGTTETDVGIHWELDTCNALGELKVETANRLYKAQTNKFSCKELYVGSSN